MTDTRRAAWDSILGVAPSIREAVYRYVDRTPSTAFELEPITGLRQSTVAARFSELNKARRIFDTGERRKNPETGRSAIVWSTAKPDDGQLDLFPDQREPWQGQVWAGTTRH